MHRPVFRAGKLEAEGIVIRDNKGENESVLRNILCYRVESERQDLGRYS